MSVALKPAQSLGSDDLKIIVRNSFGTPVDPYYIRYSLFDYTTGMEVLIGDPDRIPATSGIGTYYVNATLPADANIGPWLVRWNFRESALSPMVQVVQEFAVVKADVVVSFTGSASQDVLLKRLRIVLRDNNPDRNYSVHGDEKIDVRVGDKVYTTTMKELWETIEDGRQGRL